MDFTGKVVVITGAGKGIGKVIARKYAEKQAIVFIIGSRYLDLLLS